MKDLHDPGSAKNLQPIVNLMENPPRYWGDETFVANRCRGEVSEIVGTWVRSPICSQARIWFKPQAHDRLFVKTANRADAIG